MVLCYIVTYYVTLMFACLFITYIRKHSVNQTELSLGILKYNVAATRRCLVPQFIWFKHVNT